MQKIIFKKDNKSLKTINNITLFEREENADYLEIIVPQKYNDIDISTCNIRLIYITSDNYENSFLIDEYKQDILYKDNFLYLINIDERFTSVVGKIQMYLIFSKSDEKDILFKSGVATMFIKDHPSGNNELTEKELYIIDQVVLISNKALKKAESVEQRVDNGEFFPTIEITETEDGHNVIFKTTKQEETVELQNGKDYVLTNTDKTDIAQEVVEVVTPNIDKQVADAEEILNEKATQKMNEINVSLDEHKEIIIGDINTVANNNIDNINIVTNNNINNINNITNNAVGVIIPQAKDNAILEISNVKTNTLNSIANQQNIALDNIVKRENSGISNLSDQERVLANNLNENANQHIININTKAEEKISEIDSKVSDIQERADNGEFDGADGYTPVKGTDYFTDAEIEAIEQSAAEKVNLSDYVKFTNTVKNDGTAGVVKVNNGVYGIKNVESGIIGIISANDNEIEAQTSEFRAITPKNIKKAVETIGGVINELATEDKSNYVAAINELNAKTKMGDWELITEVDVTEEIADIEVTTNSEGNPFAYDDIYIVASNVVGNKGNWVINLKTTTDYSNSHILQILNAGVINSTAKHFYSKIERMFGVSAYDYDSSYKNATAYTNTIHKGILFPKYECDDSTKLNWVRIFFTSTNTITSGKIRVYGRNRR